MAGDDSPPCWIAMHQRFCRRRKAKSGVVAHGSLKGRLGSYSLAVVTSTILAWYQDQRFKETGPQSVIHELSLPRLVRSAGWGKKGERVRLPVVSAITGHKTDLADAQSLYSLEGRGSGEDAGMKIVGPIQHVETIADGSGIRELADLRARYGDGNWKKKKGVAMICLSDGSRALAEMHWYEAHGIGKVKMKVKRWL